MKTKIKREWRIRERVMAWQQQRLGCPQCATAPPPKRPEEGFTLAQRLEQQNPKQAARTGAPTVPPCPIHPQPELGAASPVLFRAGQIWRRPDQQPEFIVDFSDGEQVEIRWFWNQQWGPPHVMEALDLLTYVRSKNLQAAWPGASL